MGELTAGSPLGVHTHTEGAVLVVTLARPDKGNALRQQDTEAIADAIAAVDGGGGVRALLIRAEGNFFCVGADLVSANDTDEKPTIGHLSRHLAAGPHRMIEALWGCPVPTVSAINGKALGLGLHLGVVCDFVLAAPEAKFSEPFCRRGFSVDSGGSFLLPRLIGIRRARQMLLRGREIDAVTAVEWGLVDSVVDSGRLDDEALSVASELASGPTYSLGHTKQLLNRRAPMELSAALQAEADSVEATVRSADFKEGLRAFVGRRTPDFTGH